MAKGKFAEWQTPDGLLMLQAWARDGLTDDRLAEKMGISRSTLSEWKKRFSDISDALKKGKEIVDVEVENALLKRALGYRYEEVTREAVPYQTKESIDGEQIETTEYRLTVTKIVTKEVQPDVTAQIFWLQNRKSKVWRDRKNIHHSGGVTNRNIDLSDLTDEQIEKELSKYEND